MPSTPFTVEQVYRLHARRVYAIALRILGRDAEVDDVVQEVFVAACRHLGQLREPDALLGWLTTTTVRTASRTLRRRRLRAWIGLDQLPHYEELAAPDATPEERLRLAQLYARLDELPVAERVAWCLQHLHGLTLEEVARHCGCSLATAKRRIAAANDALRRLLGDE